MRGRQDQTERMNVNIDAALLCSGNAASTLGAFFGAAGLEALSARVQQSNAVTALAWLFFLSGFFGAHFFAVPLTERFGQRESMVVSNWIRSLALVVAALSCEAGFSLWAVFALAGTVGALSGLCQPVALAMVSDLVPPKRLLRAIVIVLATSAIAALSGIVLGRVTVAFFGPVLTLLFAAVVSSSVALIVCCVYIEEGRAVARPGTSCTNCSKGCT